MHHLLLHALLASIASALGDVMGPDTSPSRSVRTQVNVKPSGGIETPGDGLVRSVKRTASKSEQQPQQPLKENRKGAPRLFDAFMLSHEFDTFRAHVFENAHRVHAFIVVETEFTLKHRLKTKEEMGVKNFIDGFAKGQTSTLLETGAESEVVLKTKEELVVKPFLNKLRKENPSMPEIHYVLAPASSIRSYGAEVENMWRRVESIARDHILRGFNELGGGDEDLIIIGDVDEIFNGKKCSSMLATHDLSREIVHFDTPANSNFKHSFKCHKKGIQWKGPAITSGRVLREIGAQNIRESDKRGGCRDRDIADIAAPFKFACTLRDNRRVHIGAKEGCAWHLSGFGGADVASKKFERNVEGPGYGGHIPDPAKIRAKMDRCQNERTFPYGEPTFYERHDNASALQFPAIPWYVSRHRSEFASMFQA